MKQFNLKEYLANPNRKVVTGDGRNVRILCTDAKINSTHPIITLVKEPSGSESIVPYTEGGQFYAFTHTKTEDLFFAPEKHEGWITLYKSDSGGYVLGKEIYFSEEQAEVLACSACIAIVKIEWEE